MIELKYLLIFGTICTTLLVGTQQQPVMAVDTTVHASISHGGLGEIEMCFESSGYYDICNDFDLSEYQNPFLFDISVEDPDEGDEFRICYEVKDKDVDECKSFEFDGSRSQTVSLAIPETGQSSTVSPEDFQIEDGSGTDKGNDDQQQSSVPALPPLPPS